MMSKDHTVGIGMEKIANQEVEVIKKIIIN